VTGLPPFEQVLTDHGRTVLRVCRALLGPDDADDAWSETFLAALGAYPRLRPGSNVRGWLVTIAHRKAIDQLRAGARRPTPGGDLRDMGELGGRQAPSEHDRIADGELWQAVASLPLKQRVAVVGHHLAGLPYAEVALLLDSNETAARRAGADGLARLRRTYTGGGEG